MKNFRNLIVFGFLTLSLISCGNGNSSGGGGDSSTSSSSSNDVSSDGNNYTSYDELKNAYTSMDLAAGLTDDMPVYHIGPAFGGTNFNSGFDFSLDFTFNHCSIIFGEVSGDCNGNGANSIDYQSIVDQGQYKIIRSRSSSSLDLDTADGVSNQGFTYTSGSYDRNDSLYREMLNLDDDSVAKVVISKATVRLDNGNTINADYVEYFYTNGELKGFVLSNALPLIANPIAITDRHSVRGYLEFSGNKKISTIQVNIHDISFNIQTGKYESVTIDTIRIK